MSQKMVRAMASAICVLTAISVNAGELTPKGKITRTYTSGGWTMLAIDTQPTNTFGCDKGNWYATNTGDPNYQTIVSSILAAQMAQKSVSFWVGGCGGQAGSYPKIESVIVES